MGMVFIIGIYLLLAAHKRILALCWPSNQSIFCLFHCVHAVTVCMFLSGWWILINKYHHEIFLAHIMLWSKARERVENGYALIASMSLGSWNSTCAFLKVF